MRPSCWYEFRASASQANETELFIYNEIGFFGISAAAFITDLQNVPKSHRISLHIHSPGGDVFDGQAIFTALSAHPGGVTTQIDGLAASMASLIALAGDPVRMSGNGIFMIHNVTGGAIGDAEDLRKQADVMEKVQETITAVYVGKTGMSRRAITKMMDAETWMTASDAHELGFIDEITGDMKMAAKFDLSGFNKVPAALTPLLAAMSKPTIAELEGTIAELEGKVSTANETISKHETEAKEFGEITDKMLTDLTANQNTILKLEAEAKTAVELNAKLDADLKSEQEKSAKLEGEAKSAEERAREMAARSGVTLPGKKVVVTSTTSSSEDLIAQFEAIEDSSERTEFYRKNKVAIRAANLELHSRK